MKADLEKELLALSLEEKIEVLVFLIPFVTSDPKDEIPPELIADLEHRIAADNENPDAAISFEEFKRRWQIAKTATR